MVTLAVAVGSPRHELAETLFAAHMVQHLMLVMVAAPLLALQRPLPVVRLVPRAARRALGQWLRSIQPLCRTPSLTAMAVVIWSLHVAVLWMWHVPSLYEAALHRPWLHGLEHASLLGTAWAFWLLVVCWSPTSKLGVMGALLYLFAAAVQCCALGALITFADEVWYPVHGHRAPTIGLPALEDQQLAGLIMWIPGGTLYAAAALWVLGHSLGDGAGDEPLGKRGAQAHLVE